MTMMVRILAVVMIVTLGSGPLAMSAAAEDWDANVPQAFLQAVRSDKPLLLLLDDPESEVCQRVKQDILEEPEVAALLRREYVTARVNVAEDPSVFATLRVATVPSLLMISSQGKELARVDGDFSREDLLKMIVADRLGVDG